MHMLYVPKKPPPQVRWWIWVTEDFSTLISLSTEGQTGWVCVTRGCSGDALFDMDSRIESGRS